MFRLPSALTTWKEHTRAWKCCVPWGCCLCSGSLDTFPETPHTPPHSWPLIGLPQPGPFLAQPLPGRPSSGCSRNQILEITECSELKGYWELEPTLYPLQKRKSRPGRTGSGTSLNSLWGLETQTGQEPTLDSAPPGPRPSPIAHPLFLQPLLFVPWLNVMSISPVPWGIGEMSTS